MKQLMVFAAVMLLCVGFYAEPLSESFSGATYPPDGWTTAPIQWARETDPNYCHTPPGSARSGHVASNYWLISPRITPVPGANILTFWYRDHESSPIFDYVNEYTYVMVSTLTNNHLHFNTVVWTGDYQDFTMGWLQASVDLSAYNYQNIYIAFKHVGTGGNYHYIDDISGVNTAVIPPDNPDPFNAANAGDHQINLSWMPNTAGDRVIIAYNTTNEFPQPIDGQNYPVGSIVPGGAEVLYSGFGNSFEHSGLPSGGNFYYRAWCVQEIADEKIYSLGVSAHMVTTGTVSTFPWHEGFEALNTNATAITGWTQEAVSGTNVWTANSSSTDFNRSPRSGAWNAYLRKNNNRWMFRGLNLQAGYQYDVELWARQDTYSTNNANIRIAIGTEASAAGMTETLLPSTGVSYGSYQYFTGSFTPTQDGIYYLGIKGAVGSNAYYLSIDDISVSAIPIFTLDAPHPVITPGGTPNTINLAWDAVTGALWYGIYTAADPSAEFGPDYSAPNHVTSDTSIDLPSDQAKSFFKVTSGTGDPPAGIQRK